MRWLTAILVLLAGCSSPAMRATPLYSEAGGLPPERFNLWPLVYYRRPDLSVAWPIFEKTPDHVALRPLFSVYKLDRPERQYNLLWPLAQFDFDVDRHRVFPFFWGRDYGDPYFVAFPAVWWYRDFKGIAPVFWWEDGFTVFPLAWYQKNEYSALFPLWIHSKRHPGHNTHLLWPVLNFKDDRYERGWRLWPLCGSYGTKKGDYRYSFAFWPLGHYRKSGDSTFHAAFPFYADCVRKDEGWRLLAPLYYRRWDRAGALTITPLWSAGRRGRARWSALFPLYYRGVDPEAGTDRLITPLLGRVKTAERTKWLLVPLASSLAWGGGQKELWGLGPLIHAQWGGGRVTNHVLPFYHYDREQRRFLSPLLSVKRGREGFFNFLMLGAHYSWDRRGTRKLRLLLPLTEFSRGPEGRTLRVLPAFSWERRGETRDLWIFPWMRFQSDPHRRGSSFFPLWSYSSRESDNGRNRDFRLLGWLYETHQKNVGGKPRAAERVRTRVLWKLVDYERRGEDKSLDCFPFISVDKRADGYRRFSFLWRLFRNERAPDGGRKVDLLFIPIVRRKGAEKTPVKKEAPPAESDPAPGTALRQRLPVAAGSRS